MEGLLLSLVATDVVSGYGKIEILHGISLEAKQSEITCIIGPNGSGKSTFLKTLIGFVRLREGNIVFDSEVINNLQPYDILRKGLVLIAQSRSIFPQLSVLENLKMGGYILKGKDLLEERLQKVFEMFPLLNERQQQKAKTLSGGEQRMLELGRAMVLRPKMMMLDEPSAMLSPKLVTKTFNQIKQIQEMGIGILMVEQNIRAALEIADILFVLDQGTNKFHGSTKDFLDDNRLVDLYLGV